jgi:hypothetical protein
MSRVLNTVVELIRLEDKLELLHMNFIYIYITIYIYIYIYLQFRKEILLNFNQINTYSKVIRFGAQLKSMSLNTFGPILNLQAYTNNIQIYRLANIPQV